jgi:hypothetical protein
LFFLFKENKRPLYRAGAKFKVAFSPRWLGAREIVLGSMPFITPNQVYFDLHCHQKALAQTDTASVIQPPNCH